jgi:hypothetical protein
MAREILWLVQCMDRQGNDVTALREQHMAGHMAHIEAIVDHIAMAGPLKDETGSKPSAAFSPIKPMTWARLRHGLTVTRALRAVFGRP